MNTVLTIHSLVRWLLIAIAVIALARFLTAWRNKAEFKRLDGVLSSAFSGLLDAQAVLGLVYLVGDGLSGSGFPLYRFLHMVVMLLAVLVGHLPSRQKEAEDAARHRGAFLSTIGALLFIIIGVTLLPGGWYR
ncbi:MAG: hypothetical protein D6770_00845 [Anaerolineae bacterium]|nr:MAG: hypothetical protein D6770_00845 [Anaerolineae bacterium]